MAGRENGQAHPGWIKGTPPPFFPTCWGAHPRRQGSNESLSPQHCPAPCLVPWGSWVSNLTLSVVPELPEKESYPACVIWVEAFCELFKAC